MDQQIRTLLDVEDQQGIIAALEAGGANGDFALSFCPSGERIPLLFAAIERGWTELALWLLDRGANVDAKHYGMTPLMNACGLENHELIDALLARNAKLDLKSPRSDGEPDETALMISAGHHDLRAVQRLLQAGADARILNSRKQSAIHTALDRTPSPEGLAVVRALLDAGCPLMGTELHFPIAQRDVAMTRLLLDHHCPLNISSPRNEWAGPKKGETPLTTAVSWRPEDTMDAPEFGLKPTEPQRLEIIALLLSAGADPNLPGVKGRTPLMIAVAQKQTPVVEMLVKAGADPGLVPAGAKAESPVAMAANKGLDEITALLSLSMQRRRG